MTMTSKRTLMVFVAGLSSTAVADELVLGNFIDRFHEVSGEVVALSTRVLEVRGFTYDGTAPDAFFWADSSSVPTGAGFILQDAAPLGSCGATQLGSADGTQTYRIEFPEGTSLADIAGGSISVWCRAFGANFGEVMVPANLATLEEAGDGPALECGIQADDEVVLGTFTNPDHGVVGDIVALSERVLEVRGFAYDGNAPDAFFWADTSAVASENGFILADGGPSNNCGASPLEFADGTQTYRVEFPEGTSLADVAGGSISVWCRAFGANFGQVLIPEDLSGLKKSEQGPELQ
jgi:Electron transfer DM13